MKEDMKEFITIIEEFEMENSDLLSINESEILCEFANIPKKYTNLPVNLWLDEQGASRHMQHNIPRLKFQNNTGNRCEGTGIPISISENPEVLVDLNKVKISLKDLREVKNFISINHDLLLKHWNQDIDSIEFVKILQDLNKPS